MAHGSSARLTPREGRKFAFTLAIAFGLLATLIWWRGGHLAVIILGAIASAFALGGLVVPGRLGPVHRAWMGFAHAISKVTTPIFMGLVYFVVITPAGLLRRLFAGSPISRQPGWVERQDAPRGDLTRQF